MRTIVSCEASTMDKRSKKYAGSASASEKAHAQLRRGGSNAAGWKSVARRFRLDASGNVALIFSLITPVLAAMSGGVVDMGRRINAEVELQALLDGAVLAGVSFDGTDSERRDAAVEFFHNTSAARGLSADAAFSWRSGAENAILQADATYGVATIFLGLVGVDNLTVSATSAATASPTWGDACWMSMDEHEKHTIEMHDDVKIEAPNCHFYGNSDHHDDVVDLHSCTNVLNARQVQSVGGGHHAGIELDHCRHGVSVNIPSGVFLNGYVIPDPIGHGVVRNALSGAGECTSTQSRRRGRRRGAPETEVDTGALHPGTFCGGVSITGNVNLRPGTYYIYSHFNLDDAFLHGSDVTIILDEDATFEWKDSRIVLEAPTAGAFAGMALMGLNDSDDNEIDGSRVDIEGVVYMPLAKIDWVNSRRNQYNNMAQVQHDWTVWIVEGAKWYGDGTIYFNFPEDQINPSNPNHRGYPSYLRNILPESNSLSARLIE